jgi:hypothetical protein
LAASQKTICSDAFDFLFDSRNLNPEKIEVCPLHPVKRTIIARRLQDTLKGRKISKNKYGGRQKMKFENPLVKGSKNRAFQTDRFQYFCLNRKN